MPSEVMTSSPSFVSASPSGSKDAAGKGRPDSFRSVGHAGDDDVARLEVPVGDVEGEV